MPDTKIKINGKEFEPIRLKLKGWAKLDELRLVMEEAVTRKDIDRYYLTMVKVLETASIPSGINWDDVAWFDVLDALTRCLELNTPTINFPILQSKKTSNEKLPWEYPERTWFYWLNLFSQKYGWTENTIEQLDVDTAIGLYQEIAIDGQLEKEFTYSLSEIAFPYNASTKKSEYKPLPRPEWMLPIIPKPKVIKIRRDLLPVGNVINLTEDAPNGSETT